ncbi:MAG: tetratricopeptide repeat protein [Gemmatimonadetes bacterium]|nr:tetratricopeptide repeat protein [Gemmatimonadota bacterium]
MRPASLGLVAVVVLALAVPPRAARAQDLSEPDAESLFHRANAHYQASDFGAALDAYLRIHASGYESGDLHYNIGNAYFKTGDLGRAILFYERAKRRSPSDENVAANLELARSLTADQITPLPGFWLTSVVRWWVDLVPRGLLIAIVAIGYVVLASGIVLRILDTRPARVVSALTGIGGVVVLVLGLNLIVRELGLGRADRAVILAPEAPVQSAPAPDPALQLFTVHEGAVVRVDRRAEEWLEIVLEDGKVGWVRAESLETI